MYYGPHSKRSEALFSECGAELRIRTTSWRRALCGPRRKEGAELAETTAETTAHVGRSSRCADPQIGHIFAKGRTREKARKTLVETLKEHLTIRGDIQTTIEYLSHLCQSDDFIANRIDTAWLDKRISSNVRATKPNDLLVVVVAMARATMSKTALVRSALCSTQSLRF